jgi:hypothetical protein
MNDRTPESRHNSPRRLAGWLVAALFTATAAAAPPLGTIEECLESGTDLVALPAIAGGTVSARECRGCPSVRLEFGRHTRFFIGKEQVSYAHLRQAAATGTQRLYVFYQPGTRTLTRLRLAAAGSSQ